jgi:hypothetical protein
MAQIQKGTTYSTGDQVTATNLNALADAAILLPGAITDQTAKTVPLAADTVLIHSAADTALRKSTLTQLFANATGIPLTTGVTGILPAANGGTGVANASTLTLAGNVTHAGAFTQSFTATANTSLTLPITGTLATLAGSEALSNKTITASAFNGTVGATTPSTVAATTIKTSSTASIGTTAVNEIVNIDNASGNAFVRFDKSGTFQGLVGIAQTAGQGSSGSAVGDIIVRSQTNSLIDVAGTTIGKFSSTGLAVTGALSATGTISTSAGNITALNGILQVGSGSKQLYLRTLSGVNRIDSYDNPITVTVPLLINASTMAFQIADSTKMTLDASGNIGIGTSPAVKLHVQSASAGATALRLTDAVRGTINIDFPATSQIRFDVGAAEKTLFSSGGNTYLTINDANSGGGVAVTGTTTTIAASTAAAFNGNFSGSGGRGIDLLDTSDTSGGVYAQFRNSTAGGTGSITRVTTTNAVTYNTTSDARLKENLRDFTDSGRLIDSLKPRVFDWKNSDENGKNVIGFIAQEEHAADPMFAHIGAVSVGDEDPETITKQWQRSDSALIPILVAELKALRQRVAALESN